MQKFLKDPLAHFLLAGFLLFSILSLFANEPDDPRSIVVDRQALLTFMQYRSKVFDTDLAAKRLEAMTADARENLIRDYVEEEVLYREAKALGLGGDDYVIRRRMVQKLDFINQGFSEQSFAVSDDDLQRFFQENSERYRIAPWVTFTHVYLPFSDTLDAPKEHARAKALLHTLNKEQVSFSDSVRYGNRFPYHLNYVERTEDFVASHFGEDFANAVFSQSDESNKLWVGPLSSLYGLHLVRVKQVAKQRMPEFAEVKAQVRQDYQTQWVNRKRQESVDALVDQYTIVRH